MTIEPNGKKLKKEQPEIADAPENHEIQEAAPVTFTEENQVSRAIVLGSGRFSVSDTRLSSNSDLVRSAEPILKAKKCLFESVKSSLNTNPDFYDRILFAAFMLVYAILIVISLQVLYSSLVSTLGQTIQLPLTLVVLIAACIISILYSAAIYHITHLVTRRRMVLPIFIILVYLLSTDYFGIPIFAVIPNLVYALAILVALAYFPYFLEKDWIKPNFRVILIFCIMLYFFMAGLVCIDGLYGYQPLAVRLNPIGESSGGPWTLNCLSSASRLVVDSLVNCNISPSLSITDASINFTTLLGENNQTVEQLNFTAPSNTYYIYFDILGNKDNKTIHLTSGLPYTFHTVSEDEARQQNYLTYLLALFGIIVISIPVAALNFKQLFDH